MTALALRLEDLAQEVRAIGAPQVAKESGVKQTRVAHFCNAPLSLTARDTERVRAAVAAIKARGE